MLAANILYISCFPPKMLHYFEKNSFPRFLSAERAVDHLNGFQLIQ